MKAIQKSFMLIAICILLSECTTAIIDEGETPDIIEDVTYEANIQIIMFNHCVTCHGGTVPTAGLNLQTYENVRQSAENGTLLSRIEDSTNPMPPSGLLSTGDRALIAKWAEEGFN